MLGGRIIGGWMSLTEGSPLTRGEHIGYLTVSALCIGLWFLLTQSKPKGKKAKAASSKTRRFNGKTYRQTRVFKSKRDAEAFAQSARKTGAARIVSGKIKGTGETIYVVYVR